MHRPPGRTPECAGIAVEETLQVDCVKTSVVVVVVFYSMPGVKPEGGVLRPQYLPLSILRNIKVGGG